MASALSFLLTISYWKVCVVLLLAVAKFAWAGQLGPTDVSILYPVNETGAGYCNTPPLRRPFITDHQLREFAQRVFGTNGEGGCSAGRNTETMFLPDRALLRSDTHLARERGLSSMTCQLDNWRVIGVRVDPCIERPNQQIRNGSDLNNCGSEVRVIAQPFFQINGTWNVEEASMHLIYSVDDLASLVTDLRRIRQLTALAAKDRNSSVSQLDVHPGLKTEMNQCDGPIARGLMELFNTYARSDKLKICVDDKFACSPTMVIWTIHSYRR